MRQSAGQGWSILSGRAASVGARCSRTFAAEWPGRPGARYPLLMEEKPARRSFGRTVLAVVVLLIAAWFVLHFLLGILSFLFSAVILVLVVVAVVWALSVLL